MADHVDRRHDLAADDVVGDVQQAIDEALIAGHAFLEPGVAVDGRIRQLLGEETALGADGHDHGVLHHLRLHQTEHFGTEVLAAVGPAQAAAGHRPEAQMHALDERRVHEDLAVRHRLGHIRDARGVELEADVILVAAVAALEEAGAQGRVHHVGEGAQDAVLVQAGHFRQLFAEQFVDRADLFLARGGDEVGEVTFGRLHAHAHQRRRQVGVAGRQVGVEAGVEQADQDAGQRGIALQRFFHVALRERHAELQQVFGIGAQHRDPAPAQTGQADQFVEAVVFRLAAPDRAEGLLEVGLDMLGAQARHGRFQREVLDDHAAAVDVQGVGVFGQHLHAEVFQHRQRVRQGDLAVQTEQLEAQRAVLLVQVEGQTAFGLQALHLADVVDALRRRHGLNVALRHGGQIARGQRDAALLAEALDQGVAQLVLPVADDGAELGFQRLQVVGRRLVAAVADQQVQLGQRRIADLQGLVDALAAERGHQHGLDAGADLGVEAVFRQVDQHRIETAIRVLADVQFRAEAFLQAEHADAGLQQLVRRGLEQLLARQGFQDLAQGLAAVAFQAQAGGLHHFLVVAAHDRNFPRTAVVGGGGVQADEAVLADGAAVGAVTQHADVVHVGRTVHAGAGRRLGQDQQLVALHLLSAQGLDRTRLRAVVAVAQQAETGARHRRQGFSVAGTAQRIFAEAQEGEVVVGRPLQEGLGLVRRDFGVVDALLGRDVGDFQHAGAHGLPIGDADAHVL